MKKQCDYNNTNSVTENLPFGSFKNESSPGAKDGTNIVAEQLQDLYYSLYQVFQLAGMTPNSTLEDGNTNKQFISALTNIGLFQYSEATTYNQSVIVYTIASGVTNFYRSNVANNSAELTNTTNWTNIIRIDSDCKINFLTDTNISGNFADINLSNINLAAALGHLGFLGQSLTANGYYKFPSGLILQWGENAVTPNSYLNVTLPITYPNAHLQCLASNSTDIYMSFTQTGGACAPNGTSQITLQNIEDTIYCVTRWISIGC